MPKHAVFTLVGPNAGKTMVINDRYPFTDGVFRTQAANGPLMNRILGQYYGCELTYEGDDAAGEAPDSEDGSLAVASTRDLTEGQKMENQDMNAKLELAARQEAEAKALAEKTAADIAAADAQAAEAAKAKK